MSRSYKKPVIEICKGGSGTKRHTKAKKKMVRETRRWLDTKEDLPSGNYYKRYQNDRRWRPDDGRTWSDNTKDTRK